MKRTFAIFRILGLTVTLIAASAGLASAQGQIYVLESSADSIKVGSAYALTDRITIPAGASIRAVMPSGKTQTIKGPYSGLAGDVAKGQRPNEGVIAWIKNLMETGGSTEKTPGATRGFQVPGTSASFSWTAVPVPVDSTICVAKGAELQLTRAPWNNASRVTLVDTAGSQQGEARWTVSVDTTAWPSGVALRPDATYTLLVPERPKRQVTLRVLDGLPGEDDVLAELQARGCKHQFDAWVREKMAAGKRKAS